MTWPFEAAQKADLEGVFWRMLAPRWSFDPLSGAGAARRGGRWNEPGQAALYLSGDHATAIAEYQQGLPRPGTLTAYHLEASGILNLTEPEERLALGIDNAFLRLPWKRLRDIDHVRPACWEFTKGAAAAGLMGMTIASTQTSGRNVVLWRWNEPGAPTVRHLDPLADLPRDQRSWPS